jgi:hypothetical protein
MLKVNDSKLLQKVCPWKIVYCKTILELSDKLSNMNENIDQYVAKVKTLEGKFKNMIKF